MYILPYIKCQDNFTVAEFPVKNITLIVNNDEKAHINGGA